MPRASGAREAIAAAVLLIASLALFWPGYAMYDTVAQFGQVLSGEYDDWHPPVMARLWAVLHSASGGAAQPMLVLQLGLYWLGLGLLAGALTRAGRPRAGGAVLLIGVLPPLLGWQGVVLKDCQMLGAMLAATGLTAWWRLGGRRMPIGAIALVAVLLGYATLVRANAVFATVPLAAALLPWRASPLAKAGLSVIAILAVLALSPTINHRLLGAEPSGVETTLPTYDLAGIAVRSGQGPLAAQAARLRRGRCVSPIFWDPLGTPARCEPLTESVRTLPDAALDRLWLTTLLAHPVAYAGHRLAHLNSTWRWWVAAHWPAAAPPQHNEPNTIGLAPPGRAAGRWQGLAGVLVETPLGWPIGYLALAVVALTAARQRSPSPSRELAMALLISALTLEASFGVVSIASDLRYHLWPMAATLLAVVLLADGTPLPRRTAWLGGAALATVLMIGVAARLALPEPPRTYAALLVWA